MSNHENSTESGRLRGREIALNIGAVAGLICVLGAAASFMFGIKPLIFRSGSMSPDIPTVRWRCRRRRWRPICGSAM